MAKDQENYKNLLNPSKRSMATNISEDIRNQNCQKMQFRLFLQNRTNGIKQAVCD